MLTICFGVLAELLLEGCLRRQRAEDASSESNGLGFEPEGLETELDDITKILPGVDGVRAGPLNRDGDDLVAADEALGQTVRTSRGSLASWGKKDGDLIVDSVLLVFRTHGFGFVLLDQQNMLTTRRAVSREHRRTARPRPTTGPADQSRSGPWSPGLGANDRRGRGHQQPDHWGTVHLRGCIKELAGPSLASHCLRPQIVVGAKYRVSWPRNDVDHLLRS